MGSLDVYIVTDVSDESKRVENLKWHKNGDAVSWSLRYQALYKLQALDRIDSTLTYSLLNFNINPLK